MVVDLVLEAGIALRVGAGLTLQNDRAAVWHDQAIPHQERACLAEGDLRIVLAEKARALGDQEYFSCRTVIDVFRHLCRDLAWQIRTQAGYQRRRDYGTSLQHIRARRRLNAVRTCGAAVDGSVEKCELVILGCQVAWTR